MMGRSLPPFEELGHALSGLRDLTGRSPRVVPGNTVPALPSAFARSRKAPAIVFIAAPPAGLVANFASASNV